VPVAFVLFAAVAAATPQASPDWIPPTGVTAAISPPSKAIDPPASGFAAPTFKQDKGDQSQTVCKRVTTTGTRFAITDCRSRAEWNQLAIDSRDATHDMSDRQGGLSASDFGGMRNNGK
jgi:hypothetical protein